jgi:hypothetical protein
MRSKLAFLLVVFFILFLLVAPAFAEQSVSLSAGPATRNATNAGSTAWKVEYAADPFLVVPFGMSFAYVNEGSVPGHKRDEVVAKLVMIVPVSERFRIEAGAGPCRYNDTTLSGIQRGWGAVYGTSAAYRLTKSLSAIASWDRTEVAGNGESDLFLFGAKFSWR